MAKNGNGAIANIDDAQALMEKGEKAELWPQDMKPQEKKQLAYIASQYGLDPFFSDLTVLGGNPYVTASGLKRNAHESEDPPKAIQVELNDKDQNNRWFEYRAKLWKQSTPENLPFIEYGEASPDDCNKMISRCDKDLKAMARTRAVNRVIRLAYNINLTSAEEISGYDPGSQQIKDVSPQENAKPKKRKSSSNGATEDNKDILNQIYAVMDFLGADEKEITNWLQEKYGLTLAHLGQPKYKNAAEKVLSALKKRADRKEQEETEKEAKAEQEADISEEDMEEVQAEFDEAEVPF